MRIWPNHWVVVLAGIGLAVPHVASAAPTLGFREDFPAANLTGTWSSQAITGNPGTGGLGGLNDGYLLVARTFPAQLGAVSFGPEYNGDWRAPGITQVRLWLTDANTDEPLEIHLATGNSANFWQYNVGFLPPSGSWAEFVVDLTDETNWTRIIGLSGTLSEALQAVDRVLIRHDNAPYTHPPDVLQGDFGIDHIVLTDGLVGVADLAHGRSRPIELGAPFPNPSRGPVTFSLVSADASPIRLEVVDVSGRHIRGVELPPAAGPRLWMWDGRDDRGTDVAPGSYRVRAWGASSGTSRSLVRVR